MSDDNVLQINSYPPRNPLQAGLRVSARLIESKSDSASRRKNLLPAAEQYIGELAMEVAVGNRMWVGDELVSSPVQSVERKGPVTFLVRTQNSLYEITLLPSLG